MTQPYIIAEIGSNHNQNLNEAFELILAAKNSGANAVKFQIFKAEDLFKNKNYQKKIKKYEFNLSWYAKLSQFCKLKKIDIFASTFGNKSTNFLMKYNPPYIKWASSELTKLSNLYYAAKFGVPIILSTGMADLAEVHEAIEVCRSANNKNIILMHCKSIYPTKNHEMNLLSLNILKNTFKLKLGISDHSVNNISSILAVALGATYFEKHITLNKQQVGPDHHYALEPNEFKEYVSSIKLAFKTLGKEEIFINEKIKLNARKKSLYFNRDLKKGSIIRAKDLIILDNAMGISPRFLTVFLGQKINKSIKKKHPVQWKVIK